MNRLLKQKTRLVELEKSSGCVINITRDHSAEEQRDPKTINSSFPNEPITTVINSHLPITALAHSGGRTSLSITALAHPGGGASLSVTALAHSGGGAS